MRFVLTAGTNSFWLWPGRLWQWSKKICPRILTSGCMKGLRRLAFWGMETRKITILWWWSSTGGRSLVCSASRILWRRRRGQSQLMRSLTLCMFSGRLPFWKILKAREPAYRFWLTPWSLLEILASIRWRANQSRIRLSSYRRLRAWLAQAAHNRFLQTCSTLRRFSLSLSALMVIGRRVSPSLIRNQSKTRK